MSRQDFREMIEAVEKKVDHHLPSAMICKWAHIRNNAGLMTVSDYFTFKQKLGMGA